MIELSQLSAFTQGVEIVHLPASRIIGKEVRNGGALGNTAPALWDAVYESGAHAVLKAIPNILREELLGWTCEYDPATKTFVYIVCALVPAKTPVPEGYVFRDVPETLCAVGLYGEDVNKTVKRAKELGYCPNWDVPGCGWNAELSLKDEEDNPPRKCRSPWHWLVPVRPER